MSHETSSDVTSIVGARPQFIKAAAVSRALREAGVSERIVHTGQHYDEGMSGVFFRELEIPPPATNFDVRATTHGSMTGRMLEAIEADLVEHPPRAVLAYGDTNSTLAGALAAAKLHLPIVHVEAGLRSFNRLMPEEINRVLTDHLSSLLLCPTTTAVSNLRSEGVTAGVHHVGDVMYDAALHARRMAVASSTILDRLSLEAGSYVVASVHRAENTENAEALARVVEHLDKLAGSRRVVLPMHPRTAKALEEFGLELCGVDVIPPVGYLDMTVLLMHASEVHTDSGGLQKEAYFHSVPCVTLRGETEWVETIAHGWNRLWSSDGYLPRTDIAEYGQGNAALVSADLIRTLLP